MKKPILMLVVWCLLLWFGGWPTLSREEEYTTKVAPSFRPGLAEDGGFPNRAAASG